MFISSVILIYTFLVFFRYIFIFFVFFFFNDTATTEIYTLSLHDALPILGQLTYAFAESPEPHVHDEVALLVDMGRSEEHTSELQSRENLVCRLLLEKKKKKKIENKAQITATNNLNNNLT